MKDFDQHASAWRDPSEVVSNWQAASDIDPGLLQHHVRGEWWESLGEAGVTLLVSRETEHLVIALSYRDERPSVSYLRLPHPSGIAVDRAQATAHIASTRNPNQIYTLRPTEWDGQPLVPVGARFLPGRLYLHDLGMIGAELHGNAVGMNAVVRFADDQGFDPVWWPRSIDAEGGPRLDRNFLQLNSIAAGATTERSFFSASTERPSRRRPGHLDYPVDRRGVIFSGATREPVVRGLTRPHSARLHDGRLWVDDSGYGSFGSCDDGALNVVAKLPGWTRGLTFVGRTAFVGTSHVIERFRRYAPGVDAARTTCGVHAIDIETGRTRGSITWPSGNQIFAIDWMDSAATSGFPFATRRGRSADTRAVFYDFQIAMKTPPVVSK